MTYMSLKCRRGWTTSLQSGESGIYQSRDIDAAAEDTILAHLAVRDGWQCATDCAFE